jgi:hypothetical protein
MPLKADKCVRDAGEQEPPCHGDQSTGNAIGAAGKAYGTQGGAVTERALEDYASCEVPAEVLRTIRRKTRERSRQQKQKRHGVKERDAQRQWITQPRGRKPMRVGVGHELGPCDLDLGEITPEPVQVMDIKGDPAQKVTREQEGASHNQQGSGSAPQAKALLRRDPTAHLHV